VQLVNRPDADFRGYSGLIASGDAYVGMPVRVMPSGETSHIDRIVTFDGDIERASAGQSVTIRSRRGRCLARRRDRGCPGGRRESPTSCRLRVVWVGKEPLTPGRSYLIKLGTTSAKATTEGALRVLDLDTGASNAAERLFINDIGECTLRLDRAIAGRSLRREQGDGQLYPDRSGILRHSRHGLCRGLRRARMPARPAAAAGSSDRGRKREDARPLVGVTRISAR